MRLSQDACLENEERPERESCERVYADFGGRVGNRPPPFYDPPECVAAEDYRRAD